MDAGFGRPTPAGGYTWWYFDALSDDGERALSCIFFVGSVFSPTYAARLRRGEPARAEEHLGVNLALYARGRQVAWVMSEYGAAALGPPQADRLRIGRSSVTRDGDRLRIVLDERSAPFFASLAGVGTPVRGAVEIEPLSPPVAGLTLATSEGRAHAWTVPVPRARFTVALERPDFRFEGTGYHDVNRGAGRLEDAFSRWGWARAHAGDRTVVVYATRDRGGLERAVVVDARDGQADARCAVPAQASVGPLKRAGWGLSLPEWFAAEGGAGELRCEPDRLLDVAPFYARYTARLSDGGRPIGRGLGEYLDLDRFRGRGVQFLLRFKTRRAR